MLSLLLRKKSSQLNFYKKKYLHEVCLINPATPIKSWGHPIEITVAGALAKNTFIRILMC